MMFFLARLYAHIVHFSSRRLGLSLPGLGWLLRRSRGEHVLHIEGRKFLFSRHGASMYGVMVLGRYAEPETHRFLTDVLAAVATDIRFVDVGAAVGEIVIDMAGHALVREVVAIDPDEDNLRAMEGSAQLNGFENIRTVQAVMSDRQETVHFLLNKNRGTSGHIARTAIVGSKPVQAMTLDGLLGVERAGAALKHILLIDVEGAEVKVLRGGRAFIERHQPLIVFEFNALSKQHFKLDDVREILGVDYDIYRLRADGRLDEEFQDSWNCVAVSSESCFHDACRSARV